MRYLSTRGKAPPVGFSAAAEAGLAPDGGLYVPERMPPAEPQRWSSEKWGDSDPAVPGLAEQVLAPFVTGDLLAPQLGAICREAFDFPLPSVELGERAMLLELFWGPTAAFKDVGARFLAACLQRLPSPGRRTILVATSGDTGSAVAAAFWHRPGVEVAVLFPKGGVSPLQEHQLSCWGDNVRAFAVDGTFDDCQRLLKAALGDRQLVGRLGLTTANSINVARLLPQVVYYALAGLGYRARHGAVPDFLVPSGNVGNATAALWARAIGLPVGRVVMVTNANRTVPDYLETGDWRPRPSVRTLANAMDVGDPSNMERVFHLLGDYARVKEQVASVSVDDEAIRAVIRAGVARYGRVFDPHTATAVRALEDGVAERAVVVGTAHPAKFRDLVEPLIGTAVEPPPALAAILERPTRSEELAPDLGALLWALGG